MKNNKTTKWIGAGLLTAIASSLCCIAPLLALISGTTGVASNFEWLSKYRGYLIAFTIATLSFAWYQKLKPKKEIDCACETDKPSFWQSKLFLSIITIFAVIMTLFPYISAELLKNKQHNTISISQTNLQTATFKIKGMTCPACEEHINHSVNELNRIGNVITLYKNGISEVHFDKSKTNLQEIKKQIDKTGYKVIDE